MNRFMAQLNDQIQFLFEYGKSLSKSGQWAKSNEVQIRATACILGISLQNCTLKWICRTKDSHCADQEPKVQSQAVNEMRQEMKKIMNNEKPFIYIIAFKRFIGWLHPTIPLEQTLQFAGKNRTELKKVLEHYSYLSVTLVF